MHGYSHNAQLLLREEVHEAHAPSLQDQAPLGGVEAVKRSGNLQAIALSGQQGMLSGKRRERPRLAPLVRTTGPCSQR